jgi:hypothetical protein
VSQPWFRGQALLLPLVRPPGAPAVPRRTGDSTSTPGLWAAYRQVVYRLLLASTQLYTATGVVKPGRPSGPVGPSTRTPTLPAHSCGTLVGRRLEFRSTFAPPDARPRGTSRNRRVRRVTAEAVGRPFVQVTGDDRGQVGMGGDPREDGGATCKSLALPTRVEFCIAAQQPQDPSLAQSGSTRREAMSQCHWRGQLG